MKKLLLNKLDAIRKQMDTYSHRENPYLISEWKHLRIKELLIIEIMDEYEAIARKPLINDIEELYKMGMITPQEREEKLNNIQTQDNY